MFLNGKITTMHKFSERHLKDYKKFLSEYYPTTLIKKTTFYLVKLFFKLLNYHSNKKIISNKADILFLYGYKEELKRTMSLRSHLESKGFNVKYDYFSKKRFIREKLNTKRIPINLFLETMDAKYLIKKYSPKVVITFSHNSVVSPLLKKYLNEINGKLVNIAHAVLGDGHEFSMFNFDYYFIFGKSSYKNALKNTNRFGNTKLILSGSIFLSETFDQVTFTKDKNVLFFSTWLAESVKDELIINAKTTIQWAKENPEYTLFIKLHHHEDPLLITQLSKGIRNIIILNKSTSMFDALNKVSLVITSWSNAAIEAALAKKPVVMVNASNSPDNYLHIEKYFLNRCQNPNEIQSSIETILSNYSFYQERCVEFTSFHYYHKASVNKFISSCIQSIINNKIDFDYIDIKENFNEK